jgi:hypothetical protein
MPIPGAAQEVIHALTGSVTAIDDASGSLTVLQDNGTTGQFQIKSSPKTRISFDKKIAAESTAAEAFKQKGAYVIVFYYGSDDRTVVALKNLGAGPFTSTVGTVEKVEGHEHTLTVKDSTGVEQTFKINAQTVAEAGVGAVDGFHFQAQKGDHVRIVGATVDGSPTALFVRDN